MVAEPVCVMIIDANAHMRRLMATVLRSLAVTEIIGVRTADAATEMLDEHQPHLIVMDWAKDHTEGVLFMHRLRHGEVAHRDIPVLALSRSKHHAVLEQAFELGIDDVIAKPVSAMELMEHASSLIALGLRRRRCLGIEAAE